METGKAFLELIEELQKTTKYGQEDQSIDHAKEDYLGDLHIIF